MAVRNAFAWKKPPNQNEFGLPSKHHEWSCLYRSFSSDSQLLRLLDSHEIYHGNQLLYICVLQELRI